MDKINSILIIPDIHGRIFWEKPFEEYADKVDKIIFLGDYFDPYSYEDIDKFDMYSNFVKIMRKYDKLPNKMILLLGNHDLHYITDKISKSSRFNPFEKTAIYNLFKDDIDSFQLAYECEIDEKKYMFTHAGINRIWWNLVRRINSDAPEIPTAEYINSKFKEMDDKFIRCLDEIGHARGGYSLNGSLIWSDISEFLNNEHFDGIYQIFGHTQLKEKEFVTENFADLDVRKAFLLDKDGLRGYDEEENKQQ